MHSGECVPTLYHSRAFTLGWFRCRRPRERPAAGASFFSFFSSITASSAFLPFVAPGGCIWLFDQWRNCDKLGKAAERVELDQRHRGLAAASMLAFRNCSTRFWASATLPWRSCRAFFSSSASLHKCAASLSFSEAPQ